MPSVAIIGAGPTAVYSLLHMLQIKKNLDITIFEREHVAGLGTPYRPQENDAVMLANIASVELPPVIEPLADWLEAQADQDLAVLNIRRCDINERTFFPRVAIGAYYKDQLSRLIDCAGQSGHSVKLCTDHLVTDIISADRKIQISILNENEIVSKAFDFVVIASGYQKFSENNKSSHMIGAYEKIDFEQWRDARIGIVGSSLKAIDCVVRMASEAGCFSRSDRDEILYENNSDSKFSITLMSRRGFLPEADFYCKVPYDPLEIFNEDSVKIIWHDQYQNKLDRLFDLFKQQMAISDREYHDNIGLASISADAFANIYFANRIGAPSFAWVAANLAEAKENARLCRTVPWRYAILRMHELFGKSFKYMNENDKKRFLKDLKYVFVDNYAAVPHLSIERILALSNSGKLFSVALGFDYRLSFNEDSRVSVVKTASFQREFDILIDARPLSPLMLHDLPFPTLRSQILNNNKMFNSNHSDRQKINSGVRFEIGNGCELRDGFHCLSNIYCLAIQNLLSWDPFVQGLTSCNELARTMALSLESAIVERLQPGRGSPGHQPGPAGAHAYPSDC